MNREITEHFRRQAEVKHNSPLMDCLLIWAYENLKVGGVVSDIVSDFSGDPFNDALSLRFAGGLHFLALSGKTPELAALYPSTGGIFDREKLPIVLSSVVECHKDFLKSFLSHQVQTNEVLRSAPLMAGFLELDKRLEGTPLHIRELGASGGLNQIWDQYHYQIGDTLWKSKIGGEETLTMEPGWRGEKLPPVERRPNVESRAACDIHPMDLNEETARLRLMGYVWPDQPDRMERLKNAIQKARSIGVHVEQNDAASFVRQQLKNQPEHGALVFYHSVFWSYVPPPDQDEITQMFKTTGETTTPDRPLAWLRMEAKDDPVGEYQVRLSLWTGNPKTSYKDEVLAITHPHGTKIEWLS